MKLKEKLQNWLFKEELDDIKKLKKELQTTQIEVEEIKSTYDECLQRIERAYVKIRDAADLHDKSHQLLEDCRKFMNSICDIGVDVGYKGVDHSWAVICIHGKMDYVKFVDMRHCDVMEISQFLKRFEYSNRMTDSPFSKGIIEDMIARW